MQGTPPFHARQVPYRFELQLCRTIFSATAFSVLQEWVFRWIPPPPKNPNSHSLQSCAQCHFAPLQLSQGPGFPLWRLDDAVDVRDVLLLCCR